MFIRVAALFCVKWRHGRHLESVTSNRKFELRQSMRILLEEQSWQIGNWLFEDSRPNNNNNNNNKMSSDTRSVPGLKGNHNYTRQIYCTVFSVFVVFVLFACRRCCWCWCCNWCRRLTEAYCKSSHSVQPGDGTNGTIAIISQSIHSWDSADIGQNICQWSVTCNLQIQCIRVYSKRKHTISLYIKSSQVK